VKIADRPGLEDPKSIATLRLLLQQALLQAFKRRSTPSPDEMFRKVDQLIPHLARINQLNKKHIQPINMDKDSEWKVDA
jgi:hypothetical protein